MSNYETQAAVTLQMNGEQPRKMLEELRQRAFNLENAIAKAAAAGNKTDLNRLRRELRTTQRQIRECESATQQVEAVLKRLDKATPKELQRTLRTLNKQLSDMERGSEAWNAHTAKIRQVKAELERVNAELRQAEPLWERVNRKLNDWQTSIAAGAAALTGLVMAGRAAVNAFAEMDAELANVRKFTGMTAEDVQALNRELMKINTRTARVDLNKLAEEAGRLGKQSLEDVLGFVKAADQINVALDDLGDGATLTLSKLTSIFGDEKRLGTEKALLSVGSVINELSQNCTASAPYLAQFAQRLAGVGAQAGMTIPQIMAFAAVLDSQGQAVEMSATALSKLIMDLFKNTDKIAAATGLSLEKLQSALASSTNEGLLLLLDRLHELGSMDVLAPVFKDMGEEGARASAVISALAGNVETVRWQQAEASKAFEEGTSVTKEFGVQNSTVQADLDKARNRLHELAVELGEKLIPVMRHVISTTSLSLKTLSAMVTFLAENKGAIISLTASIIAYTAVVKGAAIAQGAWNILAAGIRGVAGAATAAVNLLKTGFFMLTGQTQKAAAAQRAFNSATRANPLGLLVAAITLAVSALVQYIEKTRTAREQQAQLRKEQEEFRKGLTDLSQASADYAKEEMTRLKSLYSAAIDEAKGKDERLAAAKRLQDLYPSYFGNLSTEEIMVGKAKAQYDRLTESIIASARARAAAAKIEENEGKLLELEEKLRGQQAQQQEAERKNQQAREKRRQEESMHRGRVSGAALGDAREMNDGDVQRSVYALDKAAENVRSTQKTLDTANQAVKTTQRQIDTINSANQRLADTYKVAAKASGEAEQPLPVIAPAGSVTAETGGTGGSSAKADPFAREKAWRAREEALNRIAYAKGEKLYQDYSARMDAIALEFYEKQLEHQELTADERLAIEAQYWEERKKQQDKAAAESIEQEKLRYAEQLAAAKQRFMDGEYNLGTYAEAVERAESDHLARMAALTAEGTKERTAAEKALRDHDFEAARKKQQEHEQALAKLKKDYFGDSLAERQEAHDKDLSFLKLVYEQEIKAAGDNAEEKLRIEEAFEQAKLALKKKYALLTEEDTRNAMQRMNDGLADWLKGDAGKAVTGAFDTVMQGMAGIFSQVSSIVQAELEMQTAAITKRYDKEIEAAEGNSYKVKKIEEQKQAEIAKAKNEANRKLFAMQVIQAVAQTAQNALNAYGSAAAIPVVGYILAPIAAAMAVAAGTLQVAAIKKQQQASAAQGYSRGGFTPKGRKDEPAGIVHAGEWVASQEMLKSPVARPLIEALDLAQRTNTIGSLRAEDVSGTVMQTRTTPLTASSKNIAVQPVVQVQQPATNEALTATISKLEQRLREPFVTVNTVTGELGIKQAQEEYEKLIRNKTPKSRRK